MKIKILSLLNYIASFLFLFILLVWSFKALKFDNFFLYTLWIVISAIIINGSHFLSHFLYGGTVLYYFCLLRYVKLNNIYSLKLFSEFHDGIFIFWSNITF